MSRDSHEGAVIELTDVATLPAEPPKSICLFIFLESDVTIAVSKLQYTQQRCQTFTTVWKLASTTSANQAVEIN